MPTSAADRSGCGWPCAATACSPGSPGRAAAATTLPLLLDILDVDDGAEDLTEVAQALYETAAKQVLTPGAVPPEYGRFLPADWRENPDTYRAMRTQDGRP